MSLDIPDPLQRWRLLLGDPAESACGGLSAEAQAADAALDWLYGRDSDRASRGERSAGLGPSALSTPDWINTIHTLFPKEVIERLERDAVERYGIDAYFLDIVGGHVNSTTGDMHEIGRAHV